MRTTLPRSLSGGAPRAARARDWLVSRPHAEEPQEQLRCDRGRAARPSELGEEAPGGGYRAVKGKEDEKREERRGQDGWRNLQARRKGTGGEADGRALGSVRGWRVRRP